MRFFDANLVKHNSDTRNLLIILASVLLLAFFSCFNEFQSGKTGRNDYFYPIKNAKFMQQSLGDNYTYYIAAIQFPEFFRDYPSRIERPVMIIVANFFGELVYLFVRPFKSGEETFRICITIGFLIYKLIFYISSCFALYKILSCYMFRDASLWATVTVLFFPINIIAFSAFHNYDAQLLTPILITYCLVHIRRQRQFGQNWHEFFFWSSVLAGLLMLIKSNYAIVIVFIVFMFFVSPVMAVFGVLFYSIPIIIYRFYIKFLDIEWYSLGMSEYKQGTWFIDPILSGNISYIIEMLEKNIHSMLGTALQQYQLQFITAMIGLIILWKTNKKIEILFVVLLTGATLSQMFAANRYDLYLNLDYGFLIVGLGFLVIHQACLYFKISSPWRQCILIGVASSRVLTSILF